MYSMRLWACPAVFCLTYIWLIQTHVRFGWLCWRLHVVCMLSQLTCKESEKVWPYGCVKLATFRSMFKRDSFSTCFNEGLSKNWTPIPMVYHSILWEAAFWLSSWEDSAHFLLFWARESPSFQRMSSVDRFFDDMFRTTCCDAWILQNVPIHTVFF